MRWMLLFVALLAGILAPGQPARIEGIAVCTPGAPRENVVVFLTGNQPTELEPPKDPVLLDQRRLRFTPHVLPIVRGTTVAFPNSDRIRHNVFSASETRMFNLGTYPFGVVRTVTFDKPGVVELLCNVHLEMSAHILVLETPYFSSTDSRGFFRIAGVVPGVYSLNFWCEHRGFISQELVLRSGQTSTLQAILHANEVTVAQR
ncbi:carboxypeptidase regulatory-like domain-containing protein [Acidobacteria bacterium AH-259-G07]|nr:carboxypeptidase regulatory-like domain-containing protein [Acidobacteria bacterium AH-259-G07]